MRNKTDRSGTLIEHLESRQLLSAALAATPGATPSARGTLRVAGDPTTATTIDVTLSADGATINTSVGSTTNSFAAADVRRVVVTGGDGNDTINVDLGGATLRRGVQIAGRGGNDAITAGDENDFITGGDGNDVIATGGSQNRASGGAGDDQITGGTGNDILSGDAGDDTLVGGDGNDRLTGGAGVNDLSGDAGDDRLAGDSTIDTLDGGDGSNSVRDRAKPAGTSATPGATLAFGTLRLIGDPAAANTLAVALSTDGTTFNTTVGSTTSSFPVSEVRRVVVIGGAAADHINVDLGGASLNRPTFIEGGGGNDTIAAGAENDVISGGSGDDVISTGGGHNRAAGDEGNDTITGGDSGDFLSGGPGDDTITVGAGNDVLVAGDGMNKLAAGDGNDTLIGNPTNDTLDGGAGANTTRDTSAQPTTSTDGFGHMGDGSGFFLGTSSFGNVGGFGQMDGFAVHVGGSGLHILVHF